MNYLGIDPGLRHTGLCLINGAEPLRPILLEEIKPTAPDVLTCTREIVQRVGSLLRFNWGSAVRVGMERQLSVGGESSALMFNVQQALLDALVNDEKDELVMPLPIQLASYMKKVHNVDMTTDSATVESFKKLTGNQRRVSIHCVDAYYLARLTKDVYAGLWEYRLPSKDYKPFPGEIVNVRRLAKGDQ